jgi:hypothetical protein
MVDRVPVSLRSRLAAAAEAIEQGEIRITARCAVISVLADMVEHRAVSIGDQMMLADIHAVQQLLIEVREAISPSTVGTLISADGDGTGAAARHEG